MSGSTGYYRQAGFFWWLLKRQHSVSLLITDLRTLGLFAQLVQPATSGDQFGPGRFDLITGFWQREMRLMIGLNRDRCTGPIVSDGWETVFVGMLCTAHKRIYIFGNSCTPRNICCHHSVSIKDYLDSLLPLSFTFVSL